MRSLTTVQYELSSRCPLQFAILCPFSHTSEPKAFRTCQGIYYALDDGETLDTPGVRLPSVQEFFADLVELNSIIHHGEYAGEHRRSRYMLDDADVMFLADFRP